MENDIGLMETQLELKRNLIRDVLGTIETLDEKEHARKLRRQMKNILGAEIIHENAENLKFSIDFGNSICFGAFFVAQLTLENRSECELVPCVHTYPISESCRWTIFAEKNSLEILSSVPSNSSAILMMSVPKSLLYANKSLKVVVDAEFLPRNAKKFSPNFYAIVTSLQNFGEIPPPATCSMSIDRPNVERCDLAELQRHESANRDIFDLAQFILAAFECRSLRDPIEFSEFREKIDNFQCFEHDDHRLLIGDAQFTGIVLVSKRNCPIERIYGESQLIGGFEAFLNSKFH
ncbi:unnamed protein product [Caenorhabditis bovis]|uniref:Uncharacterized protein n=1 Tax=Caenorhabditis bovis TaxID=2654633 RepID=A0A8S1EZG0_9PELO|nr:unnamed protein product [Caenorhabditis bovis]